MSQIPPNALHDRQDHVRRLRALSQHLDRLEQLRVGKPVDRVRVSQQIGDQTHVWFAPAGIFEPGANGRWVYRDELGGRWDRNDHDRYMRSLGRLPYGHHVYTREEAAGLSRVHYLRQPLRRAHLDDRSRSDRER